MFRWAQQQLANVAGTQEPEYGPEAIQPVGKNESDPPFTEVTKADLKWLTPDTTCVETQTFYLHADNGHTVMLQVIYSNVAGLRITTQFNCKVFYPNNEKPFLWSTAPLENYGFDEDQYSFYADGVSVELSEDGSSYTIKSAADENALVDVKITRTAPGFMGGKDGVSNYGTDPKAPWGSMRHVFWPRNNIEGRVITKDGEIDLKGRAMYSFALQGMKPHHAAARWNFANFQSPTYSAVIMEFTTPSSYGSTVVRVSGIVTDGKILFANTHTGHVKHTETKADDENEWPEPTSISYKWEGKTEDGKEVHALVEGSLGPRLDRIDVMAEVPGFIKSFVATAAGTKPYIYQFGPKMTMEIQVGDETKKEDGTLFGEATFIS
ncbi:survival factor 1 [Lentithecium fluviatile CBS 122367]|uniref:Ceramide-binding protein SVF1 n=1 Tax=Lentithecium fluviatile CBS 122367 TaxID=1168545 RepID=A0A6G1IV71_9PLEO|nr:survival factor 1 [Lentithecium fluviatile CBS 122367]